ncbi:MAG: hypothetical protein WC355_01090 [Candidatus Omnitrophota bacterium]|jgi:hypothetical protein
MRNIRVIDADKISHGESPLNKLERGIINGATFWMELPAEVVRAGTALFDTFTFFISFFMLDFTSSCVYYGRRW